MDWTSAPITEDAPLEPAHRRFLPGPISAVFRKVEAFLEEQRAQLPLWFAAAFGGGIAAWLWLPGPALWSSVIFLALGLAATGATLGPRRIGRVLLIGGLAIATGCGLIWWRSHLVAAPTLDRPQVLAFEARVERIELRPAKADVRLTLSVQQPGVPPLVRISVPNKVAVPGLGQRARLRLRARIQPPPPMALPGSHDFARDLWFQGIGGVGRAIGPITIIKPSTGSGLDALRDRLGRHIREQLPGRSGGIATALVTGDQAAVEEQDADAMRRSGLAHLLSVSGLHIAAVVGAAMLIALKLLALSERMALRFNLVLVAAGAGALAGVAYTMLTGMQVPTVRACIAALLVLAGIALGRDAISLRLVAVGAMAVLLFRPEALGGASFQMSFAAVTSIIALHHWEPVRSWLSPRGEFWPVRIFRGLVGLLLTGLIVEITLMPFALYHFHRAGLYGVAANMIAIPLTTFVIMPLEAAGLIFDSVGLGAPMWAATGWSIDAMLNLAHRVGSAEGAVAMLPTMPTWSFALMVFGGLWLFLWTGRIRRWALVPFAAGVLGAALTPVPSLLVTGDGQHLALVRDDGVPVLLRSRSGDFVRDLMSEASAYDGDPLPLEEQHFARCSRDSCVADIVQGGRAWRLLAIRSRNRIDWATLTGACADADIVIADRRLPKGCKPRWLKLDREMLRRTGGVAIHLDAKPRMASVSERLGSHPWASLTAQSQSLATATIVPPPAIPTARLPIRFPTGR